MRTLMKNIANEEPTKVNSVLGYNGTLFNAEGNVAFSLLQADWLQISPYGLHVDNNNGFVQSVDKAAAEEMVNNFNSFRQKLARRWGGLPLYVGHPDYYSTPNQDDKAYGWIMELEAREDGLWGKVKWSAHGSALIENAHYKYLSPFWDVRYIGDTADKMMIYQPTSLRSAGLTNSPRLDMYPISNSKVNNQPKEEGTMHKWLLKMLGLDEATTDEAVVQNKLQAIIDDNTRLTAAESASATAIATANSARDEAVARETTATGLLAGRDTIIGGFATALAEQMINSGALTKANQETFVNTAKAEGATAALALLEEGKSLHVKPHSTINRKETVMKISDAIANVMGTTGLGYDAAYRKVQKDMPELFGKAQA